MGLRTLRTLFSNPDTEIKTIRHPNEKLASTQTGTEIQTQIDSITKAEQVTLGTTDPTNVSELSITSVLDQRTQTLITKKNIPQSNNLPTPNSDQFIDDQEHDVVYTLSGFFPLNF